MTLFSFSKLVGWFLEPGNLLVILFLLAALLAVSPWERAQRIGRRTSLGVAVLWFLLALMPVGEWALLPLENRFAEQSPKRIDGIVVLTGDESPRLTAARKIPVAGNAAQRYLYLARLAKEHPRAKIVIVGTTVPLYPSRTVTTKMLVQEILDGVGIDRSRVSYEEKSRTTRENALFAKEMVKPKEGENWALLTSAFHMPRAVLCFESVEWKTTPLPTDYFTAGRADPAWRLDLARQLRYLTIAAHEYVGLVSYWAAGWIKKPW